MLVFVLALVGCASIQSKLERFGEERYFCKTMNAYQSYIRYDAGEDPIGDRPTEVTLCLERGRDNVYFGWKDVKYREFIWSETPFALSLAEDRSCKLQSFPLSTRGRLVKDSRIQVPSRFVRAFLREAKESGESQIRDCPNPVVEY